MTNEDDCRDGSGCGNGRDEAGGVAGAADSVACYFRARLAALLTFLEMNHFPWHASEVEETVMVQEAAAGHLSEAAWEKWVLSKMGKQQWAKDYGN